MTMAENGHYLYGDVSTVLLFIKMSQFLLHMLYMLYILYWFKFLEAIPLFIGNYANLVIMIMHCMNSIKMVKLPESDRTITILLSG